MNWAEFFAMGGYGGYVWGSYLFAAVVLALNVIIPLRRRKAVDRMLLELSRIEGKQSDETAS